VKRSGDPGKQIKSVFPSHNNLNNPPPPFRRTKADFPNTIHRPAVKERDLHQNLILTAISDNLTDNCRENMANELRNDPSVDEYLNTSNL
jgi:hypothetical protein